MRYTKLTFKIKSSQKPYLFIGSKIRGMLGYTLKEEVCVNPSYKCEGCYAAKECLFYRMYERPNVTHKYRLDFKLHSKKYRFSIFLFENSPNESLKVQRAMLRALERYPKVESKITLKKIKIPQKIPAVVLLRFETPLRIKRKNRFARDTIGIEEILRSVAKRSAEIYATEETLTAGEPLPTVVTSSFHYEDLIRRSDKQHTKMRIGGLMGEMVLKDLDEKSWRLLKIGEKIGVGKATVFGLGKYTIEEIA